MNLNYKKLGLKCGLELHQRLATKYKLFCNCLNIFPDSPVISEIERRLHPVISELGEVDVTAQFEYLRDRIFRYQIFPKSTCLVCLDEEPPHQLNPEALRFAIEIALLMKMTIPEEIHIMRKQILDGSSCCSFQRSCIIGRDGYIIFKGKKIPITHVCLEEEACGIVKEEDGKVIYRLDRQGIPLVEVATGLLQGYTPEEIQDIAYTIGILLRSTKHVSRGIGTIRQDVNVSIKKGARVEIKGVQELGLLAKVIELEVKRQLSLPKVEEETRAALPDGTTKYLRPLPGAARMYPETDVMPVKISRELIQKIKKQLPEPWTKKLIRFKKKLKLSDELAKQILRSDYLELFEEIVRRKKIEASIIASTFTSTLKDLERREKIKIENISDKHFIQLFDFLEKKKLIKEAIPEVLKYLASKPEENVENAIKELNLRPIKINELRKIIKETVYPGITFEKALGLVMSKVRGRAEAKVVIKIMKKMMKG